MPRVIIGLNGFARCGKDTAAAHLVDRYGFARVAFADPLREMLYALNPILSAEDTLQELVHRVGWEKAKANLGVRQLLQRLGTEAGRKILGEDCWVDLAGKKISALYPKPVVITDVRFANEAEYIQSIGGWVIRVERPGTEACNGHVSETSVPDRLIDLKILNDGGIPDLHAGIETVVTVLTGKVLCHAQPVLPYPAIT